MEFTKIHVSYYDGVRYCVFRYGDDWYMTEFDNMSDKFKQLYVAYLILNGYKVPDDLTTYISSCLDVSDITITIDLSKCQKIPDRYPLGGV